MTTEKINGYFVSDHYGLYATVSYERRNAGGIVGVNKGTVINTYFKGSASSGVSVGGIAGTNLGSIITSYAAPASLSTAATRGGTVGLNRGVSTNVYYLTASDYTGTGINKGTGAGTAKAESAIKSASFLTLLNAFGTAWGYSAERNGGYPYPLALGELKTIVLSSGAKCRCNADDIYNVAEGIALERFLGFFVNEKLTFTNADNVTVTDGTETVTTGYTVTLVDGNGATLDSRTVIVAGDIDCDGKITNNDYTAVKAHFKLLVSLNSIQLKAADTDSSSKLTTTDYIRIKRHTMGTYILGER